MPNHTEEQIDIMDTPFPRSYTGGRQQPPRWMRYGITVLAEIILTAGLLASRNYLPISRFPIPYVLGMMLIANMLGLGPAILALILGFAAFTYFFVPPEYSLWPMAYTSEGWAALIAFLLGTSVVAYAALYERRARGRIEQLVQELQMYNERLRVEITDRKQAQESLAKAEAHKDEFYRRTILAATEGKLEICNRDAVERISANPVASWEINAAEDLRFIRKGVREVATSKGMDEDRLHRLVLCIGEAITNALKHAGGGVCTISLLSEHVLVTISDHGKGIEALNLPEVALTRGYSTAGTLGMGYKAMISFADRIYLATDTSGTAVAIQMSIAPEVDTEFRPHTLHCEAAAMPAH